MNFSLERERENKLGNFIYSMIDERILQAKFNEGIEIGIIICKICNYINLTQVKFSVLPSLIKIMVKNKDENSSYINFPNKCELFLYKNRGKNMLFQVWKKYTNEAVDLLFELYYDSEEDTDYSALTWYYALCLEFLLDASMNLESYSSCNKFYTFISKHHFLTNKLPRYRNLLCFPFQTPS